MNESELDTVPRITSRPPGYQWWIIAGCLFVGALIGYGLSFLFPAVYEATFKVTANVKLTGDPNINEFMVDTALMHVGELVYQQPLLDAVVNSEKNQGLELTPAKLKEISSVERQASITLLKVRWTDPAAAAQLANTWGNLFYASLVEGARQAVLAENLTQTQTLLQNCLAGIQTPAPDALKCSLSRAELESALAENAGKIAAAESASLGLYRELRVDSFEAAEVPTAPIRQQRGWLIAAGAGLGFLAGLVFTESFPASGRKSKAS
jgi:uncharacterized protein involved in exopolysaccharide biosynthesis